MNQIDAIPLPDAACCLGCGYLLRGLEQPVCPECGQKFDPSDPTSFALSRKGRFVRKWRDRLVVLFVLGVLAIVAAPRGYQLGTLNLRCNVCGESATVKRFRLLPPSWISRYPAYTWESAATPTVTTNSQKRCIHQYSENFTWLGSGSTVVMAMEIKSEYNGRSLREVAKPAIKVIMEQILP